MLEKRRSGDGAFESDETLLHLARVGDKRAYEQLFLRHHGAAVRLAASLTTVVDPEDAAAEAFTRIWSAISEGGGPTQAFAPYLRKAVRNIVVSDATRKREDASDDDHIEAGNSRANQGLGDGFSNDLAEHELITKAFETLPDRWRNVLWMVDVEGHETADVARHLGLSRNSTAALTKRARAALGRAWLQEHVERQGDKPECRWTMSHLAAYTRGALSPAQEQRLENHFADCQPCERASHRVAHLAGSLRAIAILGIGSAGAAWAARSAPLAAAAPLPNPGQASSPAHSAHPIRSVGRFAQIAKAATVSATALGAATLFAAWIDPPQAVGGPGSSPQAVQAAVVSSQTPRASLPATAPASTPDPTSPSDIPTLNWTATPTVASSVQPEPTSTSLAPTRPENASQKTPSPKEWKRPTTSPSTPLVDSVAPTIPAPTIPAPTSATPSSPATLTADPTPSFLSPSMAPSATASTPVTPATSAAASPTTYPTFSATARLSPGLETPSPSLEPSASPSAPSSLPVSVAPVTPTATPVSDPTHTVPAADPSVAPVPSATTQPCYWQWHRWWC